jgi:hypothetical protein
MQEPSSQSWEFDAEPDVRRTAVLLAALRGDETIGHPLGSESFLDEMVTLIGRARERRSEGRRKGDEGKAIC